ncbi:hypothetical protein [Saccharopolyspora rhizosphaerae]|uniref:hypothetical protein n=1 Tax=Saccharopolyspora rhizosphaerae TaxID=2492662 RepID=UPI001F459500|nr:hypothetical protein [Saccharopolyspora rhizosphaerae]
MGEFQTATSPQQPVQEPAPQARPPRPSTAMSEGTTFAEALNPGAQTQFSPQPETQFAPRPEAPFSPQPETQGRDIAGDTAFQAFYSDEPASMPSMPSVPPGAGAQQPPMAPPPVPEHVEVTQPYIPAIRDEQPEFAKRLNPEIAAAPPAAVTGPQPPVEERPAATPPARKRSLMRRVVRRIIGPDLLRKDPPKKRR